MLLGRDCPPSRLPRRCAFTVLVTAIMPVPVIGRRRRIHRVVRASKLVCILALGHGHGFATFQRRSMHTKKKRV